MNGIRITQATVTDVTIIRQLAIASWWPAYGNYLPHGQIRLMLEKIYSERALIAQLEAGQLFLLAYRDDEVVGFTGLTKKAETPGVVRVEKLYVLPSEQGKGTGKSLLDAAENYARDVTASRLELHVNRYNPAKAFYEKQGFVVVQEIDIPYHDYVLNDYIMQKAVGYGSEN
ncbi:GNAT family N-acetyltransferase [Parapedobacter lycopersici]|uniref:GNAT family N-acetyltransferase n=1 Tax=Parapedobacter lycopersici TaxID=1864939 RepID=UPI00214DDAA8|nr:GNAT family N-acetyltransferase [Parapedobacter lycopersici]